MKIVIPDDFAMPPGGLNIRPRDGILDMEARLHDWKRDAMRRLRARQRPQPHRHLGRPERAASASSPIGKSYLDVRQAMDDLGIDEVKANDLGLRLYKIGCPWPLDPDGAQGLRARARPRHRRRGEALAHRGAGPRGALRRAGPAGLHRQEGRARATGCSR